MVKNILKIGENHMTNREAILTELEAAPDQVLYEAWEAVSEGFKKTNIVSMCACCEHEHGGRFPCDEDAKCVTSVSDWMAREVRRREA